MCQFFIIFFFSFSFLDLGNQSSFLMDLTLITSYLNFLIGHPIQFFIFLYFLYKIIIYFFFPFKDTIGPNKVTNINEFQSLLNTNKLIIIDFYATWCGPCQSSAPFYLKLSEEEQYKDLVIFRKCNVDLAKDVAKECQIKVMPTFKIFYNGKEIETITGYNEKKLREIINSTLKSK